MTIMPEGSEMPTPPKGVGIAPKVFLVTLTVMGIFLMLVLVLIFSYRGHKSKEPLVQRTMLVDQEGGISPEAAIRDLNRNAPNGVLVSRSNSSGAPSSNSNAANGMPTSGILSSSPNFSANSQAQAQAAQSALEAARSQISVVNNYHGPTQAPDNAEDNSQAQAALAAQNSQLNGVAQNALSNLSMPGQNESYQQQNMQTQKTAFLRANQEASDKKFYLDSRLTDPLSPYEVKAGTVIAATLLTGIDSDLPGQITAQVSRNIYDTVTGNYLLIPQGTKVIGVYDNQVAYGQERVLIAWSRLIYPNGKSYDLEGQPGADLLGMAGLHDLVNNHYVRIFGSALAFSLFGALGQLSQPKQANNAYPSNSQIIYGAIGQNMTQAGIQMTEKNLNIQPTLTIRPGTTFNILLTRDMVLLSPYTPTISYFQGGNNT